MAEPPEDNKEIARRMIEEVWNRRDVDALEQFYPGTDQDAEDEIRAAKEYVRTVQAAFPDLEVTIEDMIAEEDRVAVRTTSRATYDGEAIEGVPPTGRSLTISGTVIWRIVDGRIVELWGTEDQELLLATQDPESPEPGQSPVIRYLESFHAAFKWPFWRCYWKYESART